MKFTYKSTLHWTHPNEVHVLMKHRQNPFATMQCIRVINTSRSQLHGCPLELDSLLVSSRPGCHQYRPHWRGFDSCKWTISLGLVWEEKNVQLIETYKQDVLFWRFHQNKANCEDTSLVRLTVWEEKHFKVLRKKSLMMSYFGSWHTDAKPQNVSR
jgi:hypothetical protein